MKTKNEILTILYKAVSASPINALTGGIYKNYRPSGSVLEDCVISLISGTNAKHLQIGAVSIKIFYLDLFENNTYYENEKRGEELEKLLINLSVELLKNNTGISFDVQSRETYTAKVLEINQHYAILKMNYKLTE